MCHQAYIYFTITAVWFTDKSSVLECSTNCLFMLQYYSKLSHLNFCYEQSLLDFFISMFFYFLLLTLSVTENWWVSAEILYVWSLVGTTVIKYWNIWLSRRKKKSYCWIRNRVQGHLIYSQINQRNNKSAKPFALGTFFKECQHCQNYFSTICKNKVSFHGKDICPIYTQKFTFFHVMKRLIKVRPLKASNEMHR